MMRVRAHATFRFHEALNGFLAPARRSAPFRVLCAEQATTKHMIEALGVPHTEAGTILVNGEAAGLERLIAEGDHIDVFPAQARTTAAPPRFIADAHLGGLAHQLRMAGFDTLYDNGFDDGHIETVGAAEDRVILTRDRDLLKRRAVHAGCYVRALKPADQFKEIAARFGLAPHARPFTLCLHCNAPLRPIARAAVLERVPPAVLAEHAEFSTCGHCGRIYWKGSHWKRMSALLDEALSVQ
ncbi:MAG TPA: Mut7-C RNAse domain-containing protein [Telluria sp.]|nr:Mut7-C RNAse domain-containing protein [Telluria sp.]